MTLLSKALAVALLGGAILSNGSARAECLELSPASVQPLQALSIRDPKKALIAIKAATGSRL